MFFQHFLLNANESNLYVIGCEKTLDAALIDAGTYDQRVADYVLRHGLKVKEVFITHGHWDHTGGLDDYLSAFGSRAQSMETLQEESVIKIGGLQLQVLYTTGHTEDSISLYLRDEAVVFTGDALFAGSIGGTDSEKRKKELIGNIREKILSLPEETLIYSGHGPVTSVRIEKSNNPFLRF